VTPGRVVIITDRNDIARSATNVHAISTAYIQTLYPHGNRKVTSTFQPPAFPKRAYPLPAGPCNCINIHESERMIRRTLAREKSTNLVVTSMTERSPIFLRETARIEGRATLRATETRFVPRLTDSFHLNEFFPIQTSCELECQGPSEGSSHLLCKIYILITTWALRCSTTPLAHRATSRGGTQFAHERRAVPSAGSACRQRCDPPRSDSSDPAD
jgi:hypothetical protein